VSAYPSRYTALVDVAATLRGARRAAGLTQAQLAARGGTSQATLSAYENGRKQPSVDTLSRLLAATGSRLIAEPVEMRDSRRAVVEPARNGRILSEVIALAEALPARHDRELRYPRLPRAA
jgi:transcriptional regulator with XRE-family HTH domain